MYCNTLSQVTKAHVDSPFWAWKIIIPSGWNTLCFWVCLHIPSLKGLLAYVIRLNMVWLAGNHKQECCSGLYVTLHRILLSENIFSYQNANNYRQEPEHVLIQCMSIILLWFVRFHAWCDQAPEKEGWLWRWCPWWGSYCICVARSSERPGLFSQSRPYTQVGL